MNKGRGLALTLVLFVVAVQMGSALNVFVIPYNSTKMLVNISDAVDIYSYEVNFDYDSITTTVQQYNFLGSSPTATYGSTIRDNVVSVYGSRLDSGLTGINGSGALFNITYEGNLSLKFAYFILNDSRGTYSYYNETPLITINLPGNVTYGDTTQSFNVTLTERNHSLPTTPTGSVRFSLDGGVTNYTMTSSEGIYFNYTYSNLTSENSYVFSVYANDSYGNKNYTTSIAFSVLVVSNPACPDDVCNGVETCSTCAADCGVCGGTSGGGSGSGNGGTTYTLEPDTMIRGLESALGVGDSYTFRIGNIVYGTDYNLIVRAFNSSGATIRLTGSRTINLDYASPVKIDLDGDGSEDIMLEANKVEDAVLLYIKEIVKTDKDTQNTANGNGVGKTTNTGGQTGGESIVTENFIRALIESFFSWIARLFGF